MGLSNQFGSFNCRSGPPVWRKSRLLIRQLQFQGPEYDCSSYGLLQLEANPRLLTHHESCSRSLTELPHRSKVSIRLGFILAMSYTDSIQSAATYTSAVSLLAEFIWYNQRAGYVDATPDRKNMVTNERIECVKTPPIPSSSPGPGNDSMDMSPLPHKPSFAMATRIYLTSPTPEVTPPEEAKLELHSAVHEALTDASGQAVLPE